MKHGLSTTFLLCIIFCTTVRAQDSLHSLYPPQTIQKALDDIFKDKAIGTRLESAANPTEFLKSHGFMVIQSRFDSLSSPFVLEHKKLPGHVIKFLRVTAEGALRTSKTKGTFAIPTMVDRVKNARTLNTIIEEDHLNYVRVPHKYYYPVDELKLLVADAITPSSHRTVTKLNEAEIKEMIHLVVRAHGMLDLKIRNFIITDKHIYFVDTERSETADWYPRLLKGFNDLKESVNPAYKKLMGTWLRNEVAREMTLQNSLNEIPDSYLAADFQL